MFTLFHTLIFWSYWLIIAPWEPWWFIQKDGNTPRIANLSDLMLVPHRDASRYTDQEEIVRDAITYYPMIHYLSL
ncbi:hypothetical protein QCA50_013158 [Cerrena zonata]|uniref:Uncharacterized protein n=1 Tax=Cerrena zonata TaxID=2478898 RepID=A0AAW0FUI7_9APHY